MERIRKAAELRKWSFNTFVVDAAERMAAQVLDTGTPAQVIGNHTETQVSQQS